MMDNTSQHEEEYLHDDEFDNVQQWFHAVLLSQVLNRSFDRVSIVIEPSTPLLKRPGKTYSGFLRLPAM